MPARVITLPEGASVAASELKKISDGIAAIEKDAHSPREVSIRVTLHVHNEYPKHLYKGKESVIVNNEEQEEKAIVEGFGKFDPKAAAEAEKAEAVS